MNKVLRKQKRMERYTNISEWMDAISALPDDRLFELFRLYLGEIRTPYNKQKLVEQLAGFVRNENNLSVMMSFLDSFDIKILTAIQFIQKATKNLLLDFFASEYTIGEIYSELANLSTRLIIYTQKDAYTEKEYLRINPLVWDKLEPYIRISNILTETTIVSYSMEDTFNLSPNFLASFISFLNINGCSCKNDGAIKKNDANKLEMIFPGRFKCIQLLLTAFINLGLVIENEKKYELEKKKLSLFVELDEKQQYALLCAASCSRFSLEGLKKETQLLLDCLASIPDGGYTRATIIRLAFLVGTKTTDRTASVQKSRFSRILESAKMEKNILDGEQAGNLIDRMINSAIEFGLLQKKGFSENGEEIFVLGSMMNEDSCFETNANEEPKVLNIESTFTVTIMPGLSLKKMLPLSEFLSIKSCAVVTEYEITRQSISSAFDNGWTPEKIFAELSKYTYYNLPQNLQMTIIDWYTTYTSAMLYHGYVLKVSENNISFVENNPNLQKYIKEKLTDGIYLLNVPINADISPFISESGLEFMGRINNPKNTTERISFPIFRNGRKLAFEKEENKKINNFSEASDFLGDLKAELDRMDISKNQKETLKNKIHQRVILSKQQLKITAVKNEILEAEGMDYLGKVHLIEASIKEEDMMEITMPQYNKPESYFTIVGKPLSIIKQYADSILSFEILPENNIENIVVSRITHLKRLRF